MDRRSVSGDAGSTLIEVIISIVLLTVVLSAGAGVTTGMTQAVNTARQQDRATQLSNAILERAKATPWNQLGYTTPEIGASNACQPVDATSPVVLDGEFASAAQANSIRPVPRETALSFGGGTEFIACTSVEWARTPAASGPNSATYGVKQIRVHVSWDYNGEKSMDFVTRRASTIVEAVPTR